MGFRFRRKLTLFPGFSLNISKRGLSSLSVGRRGATVNFGKKGVKTTLGLPGTGLSWSSTAGASKRTPRNPSSAPYVEQEIQPGNYSFGCVKVLGAISAAIIAIFAICAVCFFVIVIQADPQADPQKSPMVDRPKIEQAAPLKIIEVSPREASKAQAEAIRRHPDLAKEGSPFNAAFLKLYHDCQKNRPDRLQDPEWPIKLADEVAASKL